MAILLAQLMIVVDGTVIYTALPAIAAELGLSTATLSWVPNIYMLTLGGFILLGARTGDLLGHKRVFIIANIVFIFASCSAGLADSFPGMLISRACQGIAAAFVAPTALSLLMLLFIHGPARERAIGFYTAVSGGGSALGLLAGGILTSWLSWRYVFFINLPLGFLLLVAGSRYLPASDKERGRFDIPGALTCTTGMILLVYGLVQTTQSAASHVVISLMAAAAFLLVFIVIERRVSQPMLPLSLFRCPQRTGAYLSKLLLVGGMLGTFFFLTQYAQNILGFSAFDTALIFLPLSLAQFIVVIFALPRLASCFSHRSLLIAGLLVASSGMLWLYNLDSRALQFADFMVPMLLLGTGSGAALVPLALFGVSGATTAESGAASGMVNVTHYLGGAAGTAVMLGLSEAVHSFFSSGISDGRQMMAISASCAALFFALAIVISLLTARRGSPRHSHQI
ncbi:MFS transporter [Erwinia sp. AnSW2-5]|uniref:MFS transporter n=1 Tax=Erwinia sp. AnSW2-5 TaxID=3367692 RepID=UPI00385D85F3